MDVFTRHALELFEDHLHVDPETGCVEWTGYRNGGGYGFREVGGRMWLMHRAMWTVTNGPIPVGMYCLHRCDNPSCVNVDHLYLGTARDNFDDAVRRGRHIGRVPDWGVRKKRLRKLSDETVRAIRCAEGTQQQIADRFGCSRSYVSEIRSGKRKSLVEDTND